MLSLIPWVLQRKRFFTILWLSPSSSTSLVMHSRTLMTWSLTLTGCPLPPVHVFSIPSVSANLLLSGGEPVPRTSDMLNPEVPLHHPTKAILPSSINFLSEKSPTLISTQLPLHPRHIFTLTPLYLL